MKKLIFPLFFLLIFISSSFYIVGSFQTKQNKQYYRYQKLAERSIKLQNYADAADFLNKSQNYKDDNGKSDNIVKQLNLISQAQTLFNSGNYVDSINYLNKVTKFKTKNKIINERVEKLIIKSNQKIDEEKKRIQTNNAAYSSSTHEKFNSQDWVKTIKNVNDITKDQIQLARSEIDNIQGYVSVLMFKDTDIKNIIIQSAKENKSIGDYVKEHYKPQQ
ncbi:MAG: hypothetical protein LBC17_00745 [Lactobacillaceae bacterium]|jgi:hypothetical protein|nr:hypothetical protein [Lactobacillaceae bacterium]